MQESKHFVFIVSQDHFDLNSRFLDLRKDDRVTYIEGSGRKIDNEMLLLLKRIHLSTKINRYVNLPFKSIWGCNLNKIEWKKDITYYIIVVQGALWPIKPSYLIKLQEQYNIKLVMLLLDSLDLYFSQIAKYYINQIKFDYIFSYDPIDCTRYNFEHLIEQYSKVPIENNKGIIYDIYFAGMNHGRLHILHKIYKDMINNGATGIFRISKVPKENQIYNEIIYNGYLKYEHMLMEAICANCILDILSFGQNGPSLRYYEAICYNKKLLTNNKNVVNFPFYNPEYIRIFEQPEDIDWNWVKERSSVDYHYDGRFSPRHLIDKIIELEEEKEKQSNGKAKAD